MERVRKKSRVCFEKFRKFSIWKTKFFFNLTYKKMRKLGLKMATLPKKSWKKLRKFFCIELIFSRLFTFHFFSRDSTWYSKCGFYCLKYKFKHCRVSKKITSIHKNFFHFFQIFQVGLPSFDPIFSSSSRSNWKILVSIR